MGIATVFTCGACGKKTSFSDGVLVYRKPSGEDVVILHPGEHLQMRRLGTSLGEARNELRLSKREKWGCGSCGEVVEHTRWFVPDGSEESQRPVMCLSCAASALKRAYTFGKTDPLLKCPTCGQRALVVSGQLMS
jgi:DNA-directed RNA polymerase subunit RPC12/RpoP